MASLLSGSTLRSGPKLGNANVSSLVKSTQALQNTIAEYQDKIEKINFENNPNNDQFNQYMSYLQGRINGLNATGTIANISKAATMSQEIQSAYKTNTSFNIDNITVQLLAGNATDQTKLDFLANNVLANPIVQSDPSMYQKYMVQAYTLQQSIQYHQQQASLAAQVQYETELRAQERGFTSAEDALNSNWTQLQNAYKNGNNALVQKAFKDSMTIMAPVYKSMGVSIPKNATGDMGTAKVGYLLGMASFYEHAATAVGPDNPDYQQYVDKAKGVIQGTDLHQSLIDALAPSNLYNSSTGVDGQVSQVRNLITGFNRVQVNVPGLSPITLNIPQTNGSAQTSIQSLGKIATWSLDDKLKSLGFNILSSQDGYIHVNVSNAAAKWLGGNKFLVGQDLTIVPTERGVQFQDNRGNLFGLSFDSRGLAGLYRAGLNNVWQLTGGQYGFNAQSTSSLRNVTTNPVIAKLQSTFKGVLGMSNPAPARGPQMVQRAGGGFNFTDAKGTPISAATYSMLTNTPFRTLLQQMANQGDVGARQTLGFVGNDYHYDPTKIGTSNNAQMYNAMTWGAEPNARPGTISYSGSQYVVPSGNFRL